MILAECRAGARRETRRQAASAMCLADDWAEAGCEDIRIVDPKGIARDRQQFRATLPLTRLLRLQMTGA